MAKFKRGDIVVPIPTKFHLNTKTHSHYSYTDGMVRLMERRAQLTVYSCEEDIVRCSHCNWHPDDLELFKIDLENK